MDLALVEANFKLALINRDDIDTVTLRDYINNELHSWAYPQNIIKILIISCSTIYRYGDKNKFYSYDSIQEYSEKIIDAIGKAMELKFSKTEKKYMSNYITLHVLEYEWVNGHDERMMKIALAMSNLLNGFELKNNNQILFFTVFSISSLALRYAMRYLEDYKNEAVELCNNMNKCYCDYNDLINVLERRAVKNESC